MPDPYELQDLIGNVSDDLANGDAAQAIVVIAEAFDLDLFTIAEDANATA